MLSKNIIRERSALDYNTYSKGELMPINPIVYEKYITNYIQKDITKIHQMFVDLVL